MTDLEVTLTGREGEALLWGLAAITDAPNRVPSELDDPLMVLFAEGFSRKEIMKAGAAVAEFAYDDFIAEPLTDCMKAVMRVCVENTTWLQPYDEFEPALLGQAKKTLRDLAAKLEQFGIEVNHIPNT